MPLEILSLVLYINRGIKTHGLKQRKKKAKIKLPQKIHKYNQHLLIKFQTAQILHSYTK